MSNKGTTPQAAMRSGLSFAREWTFRTPLITTSFTSGPMALDDTRIEKIGFAAIEKAARDAGVLATPV
jgi:hypothetical protein